MSPHDQSPGSVHGGRGADEASSRGLSGASMREFAFASLRDMLQSLPPHAQVLAVAKAVIDLARPGKAERSPEEETARGERRKYLLEAYDALSNFAEQADTLDVAVRLVAPRIERLVSESHLKLRTQGLVGENRIAALVDSFAGAFGKQLAPFLATHRAIEEFTSRLAPVVAAARRGEVVGGEDALLRTLEEHTNGLFGVLDILKKGTDEFPRFCKVVEERAVELDTLVNSIVSGSTPRTGIPPQLERLLGLPQPESDGSSQRLPLYNNNAYLTAFLHELVEELPELPAEEENNSRSFASRLSAFADTVVCHADPKLMAALTTPILFETAAQLVREVHGFLRTFLAARQNAEIDTIRDHNPARHRARYERIAQESAKEMPGHASMEGAFENFTPTTTIRVLEALAPTRPQAVDAGQGVPSQRHVTLLRLYEGIDSLIRESLAAPDRVQDSAALLPRLRELAALKRELKVPEVRKVESRLNVDRKEGNFAFVVEQVGQHADLILKRVATQRVSYDDVVGASWREVHARTQRLLRHIEEGVLFAEMSPRGRANNNFLIIGPYGCGKNFYLRALQADPSIIGISTTTDRIDSFWVGKREQNGRRLFELGYEKRVQLSLPTVIAWDEMDGAFQVKGINADPGLQKALQSVLDGDVFYDGVGLIGLSNEPQRIPVPIYRRFGVGNVIVIQPLTGAERLHLVKRMLQNLPLSPHFDAHVNWEQFVERTEWAHGDLLGKLYDGVHEHFIDGLSTDARRAIAKVARDRRDAGKGFRSEDRLEIFRAHTDLVLTPELFQRAIDSVLDHRDVRNGIQQQKRFYSGVNELMDRAFSGTV